MRHEDRIASLRQIDRIVIRQAEQDGQHADVHIRQIADTLPNHRLGVPRKILTPFNEREVERLFRTQILMDKCFDAGGELRIRQNRNLHFKDCCFLLASVTLGLVWAGTGGGASWLLGPYLTATAVLFGTVYWSKFAHMFFKPAAAFEKRVSRANGTAENLPTQTRDDPAQQERHSMELLRDAPMDMGLGIKREAPRHY